MTDYRSVDQLHVYRNDAQVGMLNRVAKGCEFRYEPDFLASSEPSIALNLPKTAVPLVTEGILNLPTYFAGLLPEGVMLAAAQTLIGSAKDDLFAVLAATGGDAVGDVDVRVPGAPPRDQPMLSVENAKATIEAILDRTGGRINAISAISGVQPKMSLGGIVRASRGARFIAKFPPRDFPGLPENEAACMTLARKCGLRTPNHRIEKAVYIVERFDRVNLGEGRSSKLHVEDMLQVMNLFPHSKYGHEFVEICRAMELLGVSKAGILETIRLYAYSYMVGNGDLHAKNVSLVRKPDGQWVPSPVYDIVSTLPYKDLIDGAESMALALVDESFGRFELGEFVDFGARFAIPEKAIRSAIASLTRLITRYARGTLEGALPETDITTILNRAASLVA